MPTSKPPKDATMQATQALETSAVVKAAKEKKARPAGDHMVWLCSGALTISLMALLGLVILIISQGFDALWPSRVASYQLADGKVLIGEETKVDEEKNRIQVKRGNRDLYGLDFTWVENSDIQDTSFPKDIIVLERLERGNFYGFLGQNTDVTQFNTAVELGGTGRDQLSDLEDELTDQNLTINRLKTKLLKAKGDTSKLQQKLTEKQAKFEQLVDEVEAFRKSLFSSTVLLQDSNGREVELEAAGILRSYYPNQVGWFSRVGLFLKRCWLLLVEQPREANTEGGLFPAIFGTALMVILMSLFATPLGVIAAVYLHEYAKSGWFVRWVRITVNNLAGVPSIVYGIFGLQFFVYGIGGTLDDLFFGHSLPTPTFGTGGLLWASLTMALLTLPVVIVATEEGLSAVPKGMREGALALGASQWQTIWKVVIPMSSPGILTGVILSIARAAGEVAPLMLVGVIKLAPHLALDGHFPYMHLERKFMHLGFHIYDVGFQSPNVDAAIPMVFVTTFFLLTLVLGLNTLAMVLRQKLRKRYQSGAF